VLHDAAVEDERFDVVVIGAGLVGLATAHQLLRLRPDLSVAVVEKETDVARHQSGRNSGVLHSGLYYEPGSWRALLCRDGRESLERFADDHRIAWRRTGKLVVAVQPSEDARLEELRNRGLANGLTGLELLGPAAMREREPSVTGIRGLWVPQTGVIDFREVAYALADELRGTGARIMLGRRVMGIAWAGGDRLVRTDRGDLRARAVIACAGLQSDRVAAMTGLRDDSRVVPFRGSYARLRPDAASRIRGLVYPVPAPGLPFLGVHLTRRIDDEVWVGPTAMLAMAREGYGRARISARDVVDSVGFTGTWRLGGRHLREGVGEVRRDLSKHAFARAIRAYLPEIGVHDLEPAPPGIRAQLLRADGTLVDDFVLGGSPAVLHVRNTPSPAATACLAIGRVLAERTASRFLGGSPTPRRPSGGKGGRSVEGSRASRIVRASVGGHRVLDLREQVVPTRPDL
jgi:L-2-hydroxyglutarate oxidase LhgO